jgi:hypothetical protein
MTFHPGIPVVWVHKLRACGKMLQRCKPKVSQSEITRRVMASPIPQSLFAASRRAVNFAVIESILKVV